MKKIFKNKKGFTLIELLAVIVILGVIMVIAVPAVTKYIDKSRKDSFVSSAEMYINAVQTKVSNGDINVPDGETEKIYINNIDLQKGGKSPYGVGYDPLKSYVGVTNDGDDYSYTIVLVDTKGNCIPKTSLKDLDSSLVASSCTEVVGITTKKDVAINVNTDRQTLMDAKIYGNTVSGTKVGSDGTIDLVVTGKNLFNLYKWKKVGYSIANGNVTYTVVNDYGVKAVGVVEQGDSTKWSTMFLTLTDVPLSNYPYYVIGKRYVNAVFDATKQLPNSRGMSLMIEYKDGSKTYPSNYTINSEMSKMGVYIQYQASAANIVLDTILYPQIEYGNERTAYEPYKEQRYVLELKDTSGHIINGIGTGETIEKQNGRWGVNNGSTFTELIGSTQTKLNNIKLYDGVSNVFLDETIQPSNLEIKYYQ